MQNMYVNSLVIMNGDFELTFDFLVCKKALLLTSPSRPKGLAINSKLVDFCRYAIAGFSSLNLDKRK